MRIEELGNSAVDIDLQALLSPQGWAYASLAPVDGSDPGRFNALFGRDSLIFALQVLPERPDIAGATLRALAALQGQAEDAETGEEPGKILHEYWPVAPSWLIEAGWPVRAGAIRYYATADATSWFLTVLGATRDEGLIRELDHAWRAAGGWLERTLARSDGLVRHGMPVSPAGLLQQGWRDSSDPQGDRHGGGILRPDGTLPLPPLADADSQAVALAALTALARLEPERAPYWLGQASNLRERLSATFVPDTVALEADGTPVQGAGSHLGWLLWAGALEDSAAEAAAQRLVEPDILTPYGLRTLSDQHPLFEPDGYHQGAVWPFDSWLGWGGLRASGYVEAAEQVRTGVLEALQRLGLAPELYAVGVDGLLKPVTIANRVQAWTVGAAHALAREWDGRGPGGQQP